jgi:hypothetical protein
MQSGNQPTVYTSQPGTTTLPIDPTALPQYGHDPTAIVLVITFAIWVLRQQSKDK